MRLYGHAKSNIMVKWKRKYNNPMSKTNLIILKRNIKDLAKEKGRTIAEVCKALGYGRDHINKLENPSAGKLIDIATAIGCTASDLLKGI